MANANRPNGFKLVGHLSGVDAAPMVETCFIPASDSTVYNVGDVVKTPTSGASCDANGVPIVIVAGQGVAIKGVITSILPLEGSPNLSITNTHRAASTAQFVEVCIDPHALFEVQTHGALLTTTKGIGLNADLAVGSNNTPGTSTMELDDATLAVTAALQFRVHRVSQAADNAIGANSRVIVSMNNTELHAGVLSVAVAT